MDIIDLAFPVKQQVMREQAKYKCLIICCVAAPPVGEEAAILDARRRAVPFAPNYGAPLPKRLRITSQLNAGAANSFLCCRSDPWPKTTSPPISKRRFSIISFRI